MKTLFSLFIFLSAQLSFAQTNAADSLRKEGDLPAAINAYRTYYFSNPENVDNIYNLACAFALTKQTDSTFKYLEIALKDEVNVRTFSDPDFYFVIQDPRWNALRNEMILKVEAEYGTYDNRDLAIELWTMKLKDQAFYYHLSIADNKTVKSAIWELKHQINTKNVTRLEAILEAYGWPTTSYVKGSAAQAAFLIVQHADLETQKKYLPMMRDAADKGEASWSSLALLIDRIEMREGRPQIYGSQIRGDGNGNFEVYDIIDPEYVNQRREEVGLEPLESYVKNWNIEWTVKQKEK